MKKIRYGLMGNTMLEVFVFVFLIINIFSHFIFWLTFYIWIFLEEIFEYYITKFIFFYIIVSRFNLYSVSNHRYKVSTVLYISYNEWNQSLWLSPKSLSNYVSTICQIIHFPTHPWFEMIFLSYTKFLYTFLYWIFLNFN